MPDILEVHNLSKSFGGIAAVSDVSFGVARGDVHCLIGPNGAGKSTFFKLVVGSYPPSTGTVTFDGTDVTSEPPYKRVKRGMSIKMQKPSVFKELSVRQNVLTALQTRVRDAVALSIEEEKLLTMIGLSAQATQLAGELSHGQQQWLEIGMAMALEPKFLLLDEPTAGMSPEETHRTGELILQLNSKGTTVLAVEHDMAFVRQIARTVTVLHLGRKFMQGTADEVIADPNVAEIYLGRNGHGK